MVRQLRTFIACLLAISVVTTGTLQSARAWIAGSVTVASAHGQAVSSPHAHHNHEQGGHSDSRFQLECLLVCLDGAPDDYIASGSFNHHAPETDVGDFNLFPAIASVPRLSLAEMRPLPRGPPGPDRLKRLERHSILLLTARFRI